MAFKLLPFLALSSFYYLFLSSFLLLSTAVPHQHGRAQVPPETVCDTTQHPSYCKHALAHHHGNNVYDYGRISFRKSLSHSHKFLNLVDSYLQYPSSLSQSTIRALQDCQFLSQLNYEYLSTSYSTVNRSSYVLPYSKAEDIQTMLSAILTNQQTCLDGLQTTASDPRLKDRLSGSLLNDTNLHSVSLALFVRGWVPERKNKPSFSRNLGFQNGRLPLEMSKPARDIYEYARRNGRKLLQTVTDVASVVIRDIVIVSQDGSGNYSTINDAIAAAPNNTASAEGYFLVYITEGVYQEYVNIAKNKKNLMLLGDGINRTVITGNRSVVDGWTTFNSATFIVVGQGFVAVNITFRNTAGPIKRQAVALRSGADMSTFYSCSFEGYQDTLYTHSMRQLYRECDIYGTVDFIFGNAAVVLQNCNIYPRLPMSGQFNAITAQGRTDPNQNTGISIQNATIKASDGLIDASQNGTVKTYLGRPWKEYSRTIYMQSFMDDLIEASGWREWNGNFGLDTLYYAEYDNRGRGSATGNRVTWPGYHLINASDAVNFTAANFLQADAWLPRTGVPFFAGLI
ncbi:probable pectinesterase/pectinesterase inhibitor 20 [Prosopis cineraria]|uniref:probable pectinesterase/pectinesterase inhibitor 20 n=1 Tax=Prosopis cineraria TaxID=364024 RepID=UPI00240F8877|nr:probable pectinesterase/pectinesterase inhibitor 20 [Prosopis cineraria]